MDLVIASTICFLALAVVFTVIFARHISRSSDDLAIVESDDIFSPTRYRVVERLLGDADLETGKSLVDGRHIEAAIQFSLTMLSIEVELVLYRFGWSGVDITALTEPLDALRIQLQGLVAVAEPMAA
jgi:hypothetical protein